MTLQQDDNSFLNCFRQTTRKTTMNCENADEKAKIKLLLKEIKEREKKSKKLEEESSKINMGSVSTTMKKFNANENNAVVEFFSGQGDVPKIILENLYNYDSEHIRTLCMTCKRSSFFVASTCKAVQYEIGGFQREENGDILGYSSDFGLIFEWEPVWLNIDKNGCRNKKTKKKQAQEDYEKEKSHYYEESAYGPTSPIPSPSEGFRPQNVPLSPDYEFNPWDSLEFNT